MKKTVGKVTVALCIAALTLCLTACSNNSAQKGQTEQTEIPKTAAATEAPAATTLPKEVTEVPAAEACEPAAAVSDENKTVKTVEVASLPNVIDYVVGDTFSPEGGTILVTYTDGSTQVFSMTDDAVTVSNPTMRSPNTKNVTVSYKKKKASFKINVAGAKCSVKFDLNYDGAPEAAVVSVSKDSVAERPENPVREGYTFVDWYANPDFTYPYDFAAKITEDTSIYALWVKDGAENVNVTFDYDFYGVKLCSYVVPVERGTTVRKPSADPVRTGYTFAKWVDGEGKDFDFDQPVTADTTIKAAWTKTTSGNNTYVFEAEDTDLTGKIGPSYSGTAQETSMILYNNEIGASGDRLVGYLYEKGLGLEFHIASDIDVSNATLIVRTTGEYTTMSYDSDEYQVIVNDVPLSYTRVTVEVGGMYEVPACEDRIVIQNVSLKKGANLIRLLTNNSNAIAGTTFKANAPMVDCIKIESEAVLTWDENYGLPAPNYN